MLLDQNVRIILSGMAESGRVSDNSAASAEYEAGKVVNLGKYDRFKHLLSWDEKQSLFKWKGSLEELQNFSKGILESDVSPTVCISDRSCSLKSKLVTLVLFNNTGTLQIQGPESTVIKNELRKLLSLPVHEDSVILVSEEDAAIMSEPYNCHEKLHGELDYLKGEVKSIWAHLKESKQSTGEIQKLQFENNRLRDLISSLKEENMKLIQERDSLTFALQIVSREAMNQKPAASSPTNTSNNDTINPGDVSVTPCDNTRRKEHTNQNEWQIVSKRKKKKKSKIRKQRNDEAQSNPNDSEDSVPEKVSTTLLIGDSMIKNIQGTKLGEAVGHRVVVKSFSGATTKAMKDYLKPNLELSPDQVVLHVGTNDLKQKEPRHVADSIVDLARQIENSSEATVAVSELISRRDELNEAVKTTNKHLKSYCRQNGWNFIQHHNITEKELNRGGLHLNFKGNLKFFKNFQTYLD